jgi:hypothetical protein
MDANSPLAFIVAVVAVQAVIWSVFGLLWQRRERRWQREDLVRRQLWDMEQQIREEGMSEEWRQWHQAYRQCQAEIQREARRRLGLSEEVDES